MKVKMKVSSRAIVEVESDKVTDIFEGVAKLSEVFEEDQCGCCQSDDIRFIMRTNKDEDKFYEVACRKCHARLPFGCRKGRDGALYPKRRWDALSPGEQENRSDQKTYAEQHFGYLEHKGWFKFKRKEQEN